VTHADCLAELRAGQSPFWLFSSWLLSTFALMLQTAAGTGTDTFCRTVTWFVGQDVLRVDVDQAVLGGC
jgi:hypothetical protein